MGVRISDSSNVCIYCSTSGTAFGPVCSSEDEAQEFLDWLKPLGDPRSIREDRLSHLYRDFLEHGPDSDVRTHAASVR